MKKEKNEEKKNYDFKASAGQLSQGWNNFDQKDVRIIYLKCLVNGQCWGYVYSAVLQAG